MTLLFNSDMALNKQPNVSDFVFSSVKGAKTSIDFRRLWERLKMLICTKHLAKYCTNS